MSDGESIEEAITNCAGWMEAMRAEGHPIPAPMLRGGMTPSPFDRPSREENAKHSNYA
jgi:hypothetical protein